uniref:YTH domain-containing protein n=1 Tax=Wuchereria bancrofti TaxID=6293 RepID=A0AAF5PWS1_WUCBA
MAELKNEALCGSPDFSSRDDDSSNPSSSDRAAPSVKSRPSKNVDEHDSDDNCDTSKQSNSSESSKKSHDGNNKIGYCQAQAVSNDGVVVVVEDHSDQLDEGDVDLDLVVRDECNETHEETLEPSRCNSVPLVKKEDVSTYKRARSIESYKYKRPGAVICAESIEIECLMHRAQFFLARACEENIKLAMETSLWTTHPFVEKLLAEAYRRAPVVILVFLARNADHFAGFARMCSEALYRSQPAMRWVDFKGGGNIKLQWITKCPLALSATDHIKNPFNKEKVIYAASDGCEIQRAAGQRLCSLFPFDDSVDLKTLKLKIRDNSQKLPSLLETEISYLEFRNAKRNLPIKKTLKELLREGRPPAMLLSSSRHGSRSRMNCGTESYGASRLLPLMDVAVSYPSHNSSRLSSSLRKRRASPKRLSPKRRPLIRSHRHRSKSTDHEKKHSLERSSGHKYDSYSAHNSSKSNWRDNSHEEHELFRRHSSRHRY